MEASAASATPARQPPWRAGRPRRSAGERRAQRSRAHGRVAQALLRCFADLATHRGCQPSRLGIALGALLAAEGQGATVEAAALSQDPVVSASPAPGVSCAAAGATALPTPAASQDPEATALPAPGVSCAATGATALPTPAASQDLEATAMPAPGFPCAAAGATALPAPAATVEVAAIELAPAALRTAGHNDGDVGTVTMEVAGQDPGATALPAPGVSCAAAAASALPAPPCYFDIFDVSCEAETQTEIDVDTRMFACPKRTLLSEVVRGDSADAMAVSGQELDPESGAALWQWNPRAVAFVPAQAASAETWEATDGGAAAGAGAYANYDVDTEMLARTVQAAQPPGAGALSPDWWARALATPSPPLHPSGSVPLGVGAARSQAVVPAPRVMRTAGGAGFLDLRAVATTAATCLQVRGAVLWLLARTDGSHGFARNARRPCWLQRNC
jgi:hypothetical protein